jgi:menaquinone-dependent protoporphyrinogen oxidase
VRVLVSAASKHGATAEIAAAIGEALRQRGLDVVVSEPDEVDSVDGFDAAILGSAVYVGHWLKPAKELVERTRAELIAMPTWVFSSGPVGDPLKPTEPPADADDIVAATGAAEHRIFGGQIVRDRLSLPERAMVRALRVPEGDFRNWDDINAWAAGIADTLARDEDRE